MQPTHVICINMIQCVCLLFWWKGKVVSVSAVKTYRRRRGIASLILNLSSRWRWVVSIMPLPLSPWESITVIYQLGGWVGSTAGLDAV